MKRIVLSFVAAALAVFMGCGTEEGAVSSEQAATVPDTLNCSTVVYDGGGAFRSLGTHAFQIDTSAQALGALRIYAPADAGFDSVATVRSSAIGFGWTSTMPVRAVIANAGPGTATMFDYRPGTTGGNVYANDGVKQLSPTAILFCFDAPARACE